MDAPAAEADGRLPLLAEAAGAPGLRTWSLVITLFGDAVLPRGGSLWLGSLLEILGALGVGAGAVRTAMSRLVQDGWVERTRLGRHSFYRLTARAEAEVRAASPRIYGPAPAEGAPMLLVAAAEADPGEWRAAGLGRLAAGLWLAPPGWEGSAGGEALRLSGPASALRRLAERAWDLSEAEERYREFLSRFAPLELVGRWAPLQALAARTLLIHAWRRAVLRDPSLPEALLPEGWPGGEARALCRRVYRTLLPKSEEWLAREGRREEGQLPPREIWAEARFP